MVTDAGDSALTVGDSGKVPPSNALALAQACRELIAMGAKGRARLGPWRGSELSATSRFAPSSTATSGSSNKIAGLRERGDGA